MQYISSFMNQIRVGSKSTYNKISINISSLKLNQRHQENIFVHSLYTMLKEKIK